MTSPLLCSPAFRSRSYRRFWIGSLVSNLGLWMQAIALGLARLRPDHAASWLGR
jgi:hypothetical protein